MTREEQEVEDFAASAYEQISSNRLPVTGWKDERGRIKTRGATFQNKPFDRPTHFGELNADGNNQIRRPRLMLSITYDWSGTGQKDLDTGTTFLGAALGFACGGGSEYLEWSGDDVSENGQERVDLYPFDAFLDGEWTSSVEIQCAAGWYEGADPPGSGPAVLRVEYGGVTEEKNISPGSQLDCASTSVGTVTVFEDGTFTLT